MANESSHISVIEFEKALDTLQVAVDFSEKVKGDESQFKIARDACIQRFEYCIELSWKVSLKKLGSQTKFPKPGIREMARGDLIDSAEEWLQFLEARNNTSHSYDEGVAKSVFEEIKRFLPKARILLSNLKKMT